MKPLALILCLTIFSVATPAAADNSDIPSTTGDDILNYLAKSRAPDASGFHLGFATAYIKAIRDVMIADGYVCTRDVLSNITDVEAVLLEKKMPVLNTMSAATSIQVILMANGCEKEFAE